MGVIRLLFTLGISFIGIVGVIWFCRLAVYTVVLVRARRWPEAVQVAISLIVFIAITLILRNYLASEHCP